MNLLVSLLDDNGGPGQLIASPHRSYPLQLSMLSEAFFIHFLG